MSQITWKTSIVGAVALAGLVGHAAGLTPSSYVQDGLVRNRRYTQSRATAIQARAIAVTTTARGQVLRRVINHTTNGPRKMMATASGLYVSAPTTSPLKIARQALVVPQHKHGNPVKRRNRQRLIPATCATRATAPTAMRISTNPKISLLERTPASGICFSDSAGD